MSDTRKTSGSPRGTVRLYHADNMQVLPTLPADSFQLIYIDPPFNTGRRQTLKHLSTVRDDHGDRVGFQGHRYKTKLLSTQSYPDAFEDYIQFLEPRLREAYRILSPRGSLFVHLDYREVHYVKVLLDRIFGRDCFINEIIWAYDYGARATRRWSPKHDNILFYAKDPKHFCFRLDEVDRIPYMAPDLVGAEKTARGKTPTDTWWHTIVSPNAKERTGYPTQKPRGIIDRIVKVHSAPGDRAIDFFAGSGTFGESAATQGRHVVLVDSHPDAIAVMQRRLAQFLVKPDSGPDAVPAEHANAPNSKRADAKTNEVQAAHLDAPIVTPRLADGENMGDRAAPRLADLDANANAETPYCAPADVPTPANPDVNSDSPSDANVNAVYDMNVDKWLPVGR